MLRHIERIMLYLQDNSLVLSLVGALKGRMYKSVCCFNIAHAEVGLRGLGEVSRTRVLNEIAGVNCFECCRINKRCSNSRFYCIILHISLITITAALI